MSTSTAQATTSSSLADIPNITLPPPPQPSSQPRKNILGMTRDELAADLKQTLDLPAYRATQIFSWVYKKNLFDFAGMNDMGKDLRVKLADHYVINLGNVNEQTVSADGTEKFLVGLCKGQEVETVYIPAEEVGYERDDPTVASRGTLCISSQVGCSLTCKFCHTGTMPKANLRNLSTEEIVGQVLIGKTKVSKQQPLTNIVLMGMGEPLYNYRNVLRALKIMGHPEGLGLGKRRITLSTSGVVPNIYKLANDYPVSLAVSLHAARDELRNEIVPINKTYPLAQLLEACRKYPDIRPARKLTFEYVMLKDVNDSPADAHELVRLLKGIPSLVNLIPFNPWPGAPFETSSNNAVHRFAKILNDAGGWVATPTTLRHRHGMTAEEVAAEDRRWEEREDNSVLKCTIRWPRGRDIGAACGQLAIKKLQQAQEATSQTSASFGTAALS